MMYRLIPFLLVTSAVVSAADLKTTLDRTTVLEDETVRLIIEMEGQANGLNPDYEPLLEDFEILDRTQSTQMEIVNGRSRSTTQWIFEIAPRRAGNIEIPPLQVGQHTAPGAVLKVMPREVSAETGETRPLFIETEVDTHEPYVQSQMRLTIRLFQSVNANILDGTLTEPKPEDAVVQRLGDDVRYQTRRNQQAYVVIERRYAIFPTASGEFEIPPILFDGHVADAAYRQALRDRFFSRGRRTRLRSDPIRLQIRPRPESFTGDHWLPARELSLSENWSETPPQFRVGDPVTRTIVLEARGLDITQLPEVEIGEIEGAKIYPDKPATKRSADNEWVYGTREQKLAVVPTQAGSFSLPEIRLAWWDTDADQERVALIPAREILVSGSAEAYAEAPPPLEAIDAPEAASADEQADVAPSDGADSPAAPVAGFWPYLSGALFIAWIATLLAWQRQSLERHRARSETPEFINAQEALSALRKACKRNRPRDAREALLAWGQTTFSGDPPLSLGPLAARVGDTALDAQLRTLDQALYGEGEWDGQALWTCAREALKPRTEKKTRPAVLPDLYPQRA